MPESNYSFLDKLIHRVAFNTVSPQIALADVEDRLYAARLQKCDATRPVFITGLPRAGTTLLLEYFARSPLLASHRYCDMPFVLVPMLWNSYWSRYRVESHAKERAHADGMLISVDSPEALEEIVWKAFWRRQYKTDRIQPWDANAPDVEFVEFFQMHLRKIILLRRPAASGEARYISKNNLNIARLGWLRNAFPQCVISVPFRDPLQHAMSLLRQHQRFVQLQREDAFTLEYMTAVGHFDFGKNLRPIDFDRWLDAHSALRPDSLEFWLRYWIATYGHLHEHHRKHVHFSCYETLCAQPREAMRNLGDKIGVDGEECLSARAEPIRESAPREVDVGDIPSDAVELARQIYARLREESVY